MRPSLFRTEIRHVRTTPLRHAFANRSYWWFVDLDHLPALPRVLRPLARIEARDHLFPGSDPRSSLRDNVDAFCAARGFDLTGGRVTMLANARVLGHVFNPLSVFWCHRADGSLACTLAEVRNTYGGAHTYLIPPPGETGPRAVAHVARVEKVFYVSPFNPVDGHYTMSLPEPVERLSLTVTLHRPGQAPFVASVRGTAEPATTAAVLRTSLRRPLETRAVSLRITVQGVLLWLKRLPVVARAPDVAATTASPVPALEEVA